jgi:ADP-ribosyl-[dinitrogen reductase] hydrolase
MIGGGPFGLIPGEFTDDTSTALLLGESLISKHGFSAIDQLNRYYDWYTQGHLGSNNECFDIGIGTRKAILAFKESGIAFPKEENETRAGNGSLMRLAPLVLAFHNQKPADLLNLASLSSRTTHTAISCLEACQFYASLIVGALNGVNKATLLEPNYYQNFCSSSSTPFCPEILAIVEGSYKVKQPPEIIGGGYVVHALEAALWAFASTESFEDGVLKVANLGNDADTTAAIYGELAGAFYGEDSIPLHWRTQLAFYPFIVVMASELYRKSSVLSHPNDGDASIKTGFSSVPDQSSSDTSVSKNYEDTHACLLSLESGYSEIKKRLSPGPKQFSTLSDLDLAVEAFKAIYLKTAPDCPAKDSLLENDWIARIIKVQRNKLQLKLAKPKLVLPFALKKTSE